MWLHFKNFKYILLWSESLLCIEKIHQILEVAYNLESEKHIDPELKGHPPQLF